MALDPALATAIAGLQRELANLGNRLTQVEQNQRSSQLANSSVENGSITFNDATGTPQLVSGLQPDGSFAHASVTSQAPVAPSAPTTAPGVLSAMVIWDGGFADGSAALADFAGVQVHVSAVSGFTPDATTMRGGMPGAGTFGVGNLSAGVTYYACLVAYNVAGNTSPPGAQAPVTPQSVPANIPPRSLVGLQLQTGTLTYAQLAEDAGILGQQIANQTITGDNIRANTLTANLLEAGIAIVGVIDGTVVNAPTINGGTINAGTFNGSDFTISPLGFFVYGGPPATGSLAVAITPATTRDGFGNTGYQGVTIASGALTFPWSGGTNQVVETGNGTLAYVESSSGNTYKLGIQVIQTTGTVTVSSGTPVVVLQVNVAALAYHVRVLVAYLCAGGTASGSPSFGWASAGAVVSNTVGQVYFSNSGGGSGNVFSQVINVSGAPGLLQGPALVTNGLFAYQFEGVITFSAAGSFSIRAQTSGSTFSCAINSYVELMPIS